MREFITALILTTLSGLCTGIGGIAAVLSRRVNDRLMAASLGFSAGIMITVSLADLLPHGGSVLVEQYGHIKGTVVIIIAVITGMALSYFAEELAPRQMGGERKSGGAYRLGIVTAVTVAIHNFPEGIATFMSSYADFSLGIPLAFSVALHNIPEGLAISMPIYYATHSRKNAVGYAFFSGLSEPAGAVIAFFILKPYINDITLAFIFGIIVGLMCYIAFDELIPSSLSYRYPSAALTGILVGMLVMIGSIFVMA